MDARPSDGSLSFLNPFPPLLRGSAWASAEPGNLSSDRRSPLGRWREPGAGEVSAVEILTSRTLQTAAGQALPTGDLSVIRADIPARNGVIQVVDGVLLPAGG